MADGRKRKTVFEVYEKRRKTLDVRNKTRVVLGDSFTRWRALKTQLGFPTDAAFANFLLDSYMKTKNQLIASVSVNVPVWEPNMGDQSLGCSEESPHSEETEISGDEDRNNNLLISEVQNEAECPQMEDFTAEYQPKIIEVKQEPEQMELQLNEPEATFQNDEESDVSEEEEKGPVKKRRKEASSDEDWVPRTITEALPVEARNSSSEEDSEGELELFDDGETSASYRQIEKHLCTECGTLYGAKKSHTCIYKLKPHVCNMCGRRYATEGSLKIHSKAHTNNSEHRCWCCYAIFKTKQEKVAHKEIHRNQAKPYQCRHCPSSFALFAERTKHNKIHRGPFEYKCDKCGISFWEKQQLERHMVVHTGAKPFKCLVCGRGFNQDGHLKSHMRLHTGERPYVCPHCDKAFNHNVSLKSHVQRYHPESELRLDKSVVVKKEDIHELGETGITHVDDAQKQDTAQNQQETVVKQKYRRPRTGRSLGRPKRPPTENTEQPRPKSSRQNKNSSDDSNDEDFLDENIDDFTDDFSFDITQGGGQNLNSGKRRGRPRKN